MNALNESFNTLYEFNLEISRYFKFWCQFHKISSCQKFKTFPITKWGCGVDVKQSEANRKLRNKLSILIYEASRISIDFEPPSSLFKCLVHPYTTSHHTLNYVATFMSKIGFRHSLNSPPWLTQSVPKIVFSLSGIPSRVSRKKKLCVIKSTSRSFNVQLNRWLLLNAKLFLSLIWFLMFSFVRLRLFPSCLRQI